MSLHGLARLHPVGVRAISASFHLPEPLGPLASLEKKHPLGALMLSENLGI